ncbi:MAG: preprotein translocase subunit SecA [Eubacteriales bacterium]|jgi:preprotein translocase subunit SecA|nr:preprotein translocase subunit SecA [Eubacteriales bacterium]
MKKFFERIMGTYSDRELRRIMPIADKVDSYEEIMKGYTDSQLRGKTAEFKERLSKGETLDDILPEAYAVVREAAWRVLGMRHFKVQIIGGIVLHQGRIAEMKTGEGKTLVATLPAYLNALTGQGVHIVTVNDYLAKRDSEWMGKVYNYLGLSVGLIVHGLDSGQRREAYAADITYGTNNEFGFDYLRDNMVIYKEHKVQRGHAFAIVDEVDSILIDEARTPLIISGEGDKSTILYERADKFARTLKPLRIKESDDKQHDDDVDADYIIDEKANTATLTEKGIKKAEGFFGIENLSDSENLAISHHINQAIRAHGIMQRDKDYVVKDGEVIIVDEFTGRLMMGRRYSDGLHQAIEAKEGVKVERESKTLATITFQNYFRLYKKLSGMTGTAQTEEEEFRAIYKLDVIVIPTNKPMIREDLPDAVYKNERGKIKAVIEQIKQCHAKGQPVLVGTITIEKSEQLSKELKKIGIPHEVLNAKFHEKEAEIVSQAGKKGAVTIATNMAGRGTDIVLGGNAEFMAKREMQKMGFEPYLISESTSYADTDDEEILNARKVYKELYEKYKPVVEAERKEVIEAGGLFIIGTERHESRRIDNQLRGRSGRQGDVGVSKFYISLEDDLMRLFGSDRLTRMVETLGLEEDQPIEAKMLTNAIESAQKKVEGRNFNIRKHVLQYDDVMNQQREIIYKQRSQVLDGENLRDYFVSMISFVADNIVENTVGQAQYEDDFSWEQFFPLMLEKFGIVVNLSEDKRREMTKESLKEFIVNLAMQVYEQKEKEIGEETMRELERVILLQVVDQKWMDHIDAMDQLRSGIGLRAYAQHDPVVEYKFEGMDMFDEMIANIKTDAVRHIFHARIKNQEVKREQVAKPTFASHGGSGELEGQKPVVKGKKIGRNEPCPCGSGKKYKKCCGQ